MNGISTHILDLLSGKPACGVRTRLFFDDQAIASATTDQNGRVPALLPPEAALLPGKYRLLFDIADYFPDGFYSEVIVSFLVRDSNAHYHVPLLISPFGYSTYRGS